MRIHRRRWVVVLAAFAVGSCASQEIAPPVSGDTGDGGTAQCDQEDAPENVFLKQGFLAEAEWWKCPKPRPGPGGAAFTSVEGSLATVTGSTARLWLEWEVDDSLASQGVGSLQGKYAIFWYGTSRSGGYYRVPIEAEENPLPVDLYLNFDAYGGQYQLNFAVDDGSGSPRSPAIGGVLAVDFDVIEVGSGDIQINLNWDTEVDLDLHVTDPSEFEIFFGAMSSESGGRLDLDSYAACLIEGDRGHGNENVFWPVGKAPEGEYLIAVDLFSDCDTFARDIDTHYRVTLILDRSDVWMYEGVFSPQERPLADYPIEEIVRFTYPQ